MDTATSQWLGYKQILDRQMGRGLRLHALREEEIEGQPVKVGLFLNPGVHALLMSEIPSGYAISVGLPTKRWLRPGYAFFAGPSRRQPDQPARQGAPDRWWVADAATGHLILYALCDAVSFAPGEGWETAELPPAAMSLDALRKRRSQIVEFLDRLAPEFFADKSGDAASRKELLEALADYVPEPILRQHRALAPDFFGWLEA